MKKFIACLAFTLGLMIATFGTALADTYDIPVIVGGKVVTITVEVKDSAVISASTVSKGVFLGKPQVRIEEKKVVEGGYWAKQMPDALERVAIEKDKFTGSTFYSSELNVGALDSSVYPYVGTDGKRIWFRFKAILITDELVYAESCTIVADGEKFSLKFNPSDAYRDYGASYVFEGIDYAVSGNKDIEMLKTVANAENIQIRFYGHNSNYDHEVTKDEKRAFAEALAVYELLGGDLGEQ